ncbi:MAG: serine/threonine protein kinase [Deltaproteobacteria bacterium]|nr:serine/threonine protein kinase [Deltaproteobacteria bacterium]
MQTVGGRYALEQSLVRVGRVFRARHLQLGKMFALEVVAPTFAGNEEARRRFQAEARTASELSHPGLVPVVDFGEDPGVGAYMVSELVEGLSLANQPLPLSVRRALDILGQLADVVEHVHRRGLVHGDLRADAIIMVPETTPGGRRQIARLLDLGIAQRYMSSNPAPAYLAPERIAGGPPTVASDVYALGVLGFLLLTGQLPFNGSVADVLMAQVYERPPTIASARREPMDDAIESFIARALAKDPDERHRSAAAFRHDLNAVLELLVMHRRMHTSDMIEPINAREAAVHMLFEHTGLAQAVIASSGLISVANRAFARLVGDRGNVEGFDVTELALFACVPDLLRVIKTVQHDQVAQEIRIGKVVLWIAPFSSEAVHMIARLDQIVS